MVFFSLGRCGYAESDKAFLYSLYNIEGYNPVKLQIKSEQTWSAIQGCFLDGPSFGDDILTSGQDGLTYCGVSYTAPPGYSSQCSFYAGSFQFSSTDIEVLYETII